MRCTVSAGPPDAGAYSNREFVHLAELTARRRQVWMQDWFKDFPELRDLADACRNRILDIELARGDTETAASGPALALGSVWGIDTLVRILQALGKERAESSHASSMELAMGLSECFTVLSAARSGDLSGRVGSGSRGPEGQLRPAEKGV